MKLAPLWNMIVKKGIGCDSRLDDSPYIDSCVEKICAARIISCGLLQDEALVSGINPSDICFPFPEFWLEWQIDRGSLCGILAKGNNAGEMDLFFVYHSKNHETPLAIFRFTAESWESRGKIRKFCVDAKSDEDFILGVTDPELTRNGAEHIIRAFCYYLSIISCKNARLEPEQMFADRKMTEARSKPGSDGFRYHVVKIKRVGRSGGGGGSDFTLGEMPLHICRGHFSEYGPEYGKGLLFGKYAGRFYIPPHMRGDEKNGKVDKDYVLETQA